MVIEAKTYLARTPVGEWLTHPHGPPKERSPFQQAGSAMHRVKEWVRRHGLPDVLSVCVVIVPDMDVSAGRERIEWAARQGGGRVLDRARALLGSLDSGQVLVGRLSKVVGCADRRARRRERRTDG